MKDIQRFIAGFRQFQSEYFGTDPSVFDQLKTVQNPRTMMIGCSDSRVDPALLTQGTPGEIFVVRNVANLVPPCERDSGRHGVSAALEFAICSLNVQNLIILGHSGCGGIKALMTGSYESDDSSFINRWVSMAGEVRERVLVECPEDDPRLQQRAAELASILNSIKNLNTFTFVQERLDAGTLSIYGWYFDLDSGELMGYDADSGLFRNLDDDHTGIVAPVQKPPQSSSMSQCDEE